MGLGSPLLSKPQRAPRAPWVAGGDRCVPAPWGQCLSLGIPSGSRSPPGLVAANPEAWLPGPGLASPSPPQPRSNFSPTLLPRSCVSPAHSLWTAAGLVLPVRRSRCPAQGPTLPEHPSPPEASSPQTSEPHGWAGSSVVAGKGRAALGRPRLCHSSFSPSLPPGQGPWRGPHTARNWHGCPALPSVWHLAASDHKQLPYVKGDRVSLKCLAQHLTCMQ